MLYRAIFCLSVLFSSIAYAQEEATSSEVMISHQTGAVDVSKMSGPFEEGTIVAKMGNNVIGEFKLYQDDFFKKRILNGNATFENTSTQKIYLSYYVNVEDGDGNLIACSSGNLDVEPGSKMQYGSALMHLPKEQFEKIKNFKITLYESFAPIGKMQAE